MTGLLKDVMHERADSLEEPRLDVAAIIRDGDRRSGRRRQGLVGGLVAASLAVAASVGLLVLRPGDDGNTRIAAKVHSYDVAYALGGTIHDGRRTVDTGIRIAALVQGVSGYVVADEQRGIHTVVDGETRQVGRLASPRENAPTCRSTRGPVRRSPGISRVSVAEGPTSRPWTGGPSTSPTPAE